MDSIVIMNSKAIDEGIVFISKGNNMKLINCILELNYAKSGTLYIESSWIEIMNSLFKNNTVESSGGALYIDEESEAYVSFSHFYFNRAKKGAISFINSNLNLKFTSITTSGNLADLGGSFYFTNQNSTYNFNIQFSSLSDEALIAGGSFFTQVTNTEVPNFIIASNYINSIAPYGSTYATNPKYIIIQEILSNENNIYSNNTNSVSIYSGQQIDLTVNVIDAYGSNITFFPGLMIELSSPNLIFDGTISLPLNLFTKFKNINLFGFKWQTHELLINGLGVDIPLIPKTLNIYMDSCPLGFIYVNNFNYDICYKCSKGSYSIKLNADKCFNNCKGFTCHGGNTISYRPGYWIQAYPDGSLNSIPCLNGNCIGGTFSFLYSGILLPFNISTTSLFQLSSNMNNELFSLFYNNSVMNKEEFSYAKYYIGAECNGNRQGVLCAECLPGYELFKNICVKCNQANVFVIFFHLIYIILITLYIHYNAQKRGSLIERIFINFMQTSILIIDIQVWFTKNSFSSIRIVSEFIQSYQKVIVKLKMIIDKLKKIFGLKN